MRRSSETGSTATFDQLEALEMDEHMIRAGFTSYRDTG